MKRFLKIFAVLAIGFFPFGHSRAQDEDGLFRAVRVKGNVMVYRNENDETSRLYTSQSVDDGDKITTAADSEVVLRIRKKLYLYLAPHSKIHILRLQQGDKGFQCQINLVTGRMLCQLDEAPDWSLEVSAGSVLCHEHGTLFQISRREDELTVVSFEGVVVANYHGKTAMAKANEVIKLDHGKFRNKTHHLKNDQQEQLQAWQGLLAEIDK